MKTDSNRQKKVSELIKTAVTEILRKGKWIDDRLINNFVTITEVKVTADLGIAKCLFLPFPNSSISKDEYLEAFENSKNAIRKQVTEKVNLKFSPEIRFMYDHASENAFEVQSVLHKIRSKE